MPTGLLVLVAIGVVAIVASSLANVVASRHQTASNYAVAAALVQQAKGHGEQAKVVGELVTEVRAGRESKARITQPMATVVP